MQVNDDSAVDHPRHYNSHPSGVECVDVAEHMGFNIGNAVKYLWRAPYKGNQLEDLEKARWYITREIERRQRAAAPSHSERLNSLLNGTK